jgi:aminopeptidase N
MKKPIYVLCVLVLELVLWGGFLSGQAIDVRQWPLQEERSRDYDALHYRIRLNLDIAGKAFEGETTVTLSPLKDGFDRCELDARSFIVSGVWNNWGSPLKFEQTEEKLIVHLNKKYLFGETLSFTVAYTGRNPKDGLRFYAESEDNPMLVASDSWPYGVRHWFPCNDYPNDKVTNEVIATVPAPHKVVSNGRLESVSEDAGSSTSTWHWVQDLPHSTYLIVLAAAPYVVVRDSYGKVPINYWVYPRHEDNARLVFGKTPKMMEYFNRIYGYEYMGHRIMYDERGEQDFSSIGIVSHELAHQWWGDLITLRSWAHTWMNESFGTYSDYLYQRHERGENEGAVNLLGKKDSYLREARTRYMRPIVYDRYRRPQDMFDSHTYPKGAVVLHMLRFVLGDDAFFRTLKHFLHEHAFQPVDTHDFAKAVKTVTGQSMDWFFAQWLFRPGHPVFDIHTEWSAQEKKITLKIEQTQDTTKDIPIYRTPVVIGITTEKGKKSTKVWIEDQKETFTFPCDSKPLLVRFDEGNYLLKEWTYPKSREELLFQLRNDDVIGRMWAAAELERHRKDTGVMTRLEDSARKDPFWSVRRSAVLTLGQTRHERMIPFLKERCLDEISAVRIAALSQLGEYKKPELVDFLKRRFKEEDSYRAQAEVIRAVSRCGGKDAIPFLEEAAKVPSPRHVIRNAAQRALKDLRITKRFKQRDSIWSVSSDWW